MAHGPEQIPNWAALGVDPAKISMRMSMHSGSMPMSPIKTMAASCDPAPESPGASPTKASPAKKLSPLRMNPPEPPPEVFMGAFMISVPARATVGFRWHSLLLVESLACSSHVDHHTLCQAPFKRPSCGSEGTRWSTTSAEGQTSGASLPLAPSAPRCVVPLIFLVCAAGVPLPRLTFLSRVYHLRRSRRCPTSARRRGSSSRSRNAGSRRSTGRRAPCTTRCRPWGSRCRATCRQRGVSGSAPPRAPTASRPTPPTPHNTATQRPRC